jgi:hypothetical protein
MSSKLTPRQVIARSYPTWDYAMADRLIAWLDDCGYTIVEKPELNGTDQFLLSDAAAQLAPAC